MKLVPLGGLGEIGLNAMVVETAGHRLLIDAGLMFPHSALPGVEVIFPDFQYLAAAPDRLRAVLLTHGHEDHVGALPALLRQLAVPVYGAPYTLGVVRRKLEEANVSAELRAISPGERIELAEGVTAEAIRVCHSTPDALGFALHTPEGRVVHTGDFKLDDHPWDGKGTDLARLGELGEEGVTCLLSDSTNAEVEGHTGSEHGVGVALSQLLQDAPGRVVVALFASNVPRLQLLVSLAAKLERRVALVGRSMLRAFELASSLGHLRVPPGLMVSLEEAGKLARSRVMLLTTGAQGEPRAGLQQLASGELKDIRLEPGDHVVLSARAIPGNERTVSEVINRFCQRGIRVSHPGTAPGIHVSGHAARAQQRQVLETVRPRCFVPIHGEPRHLLAHLDVARAAGVAPEGLLLAGDGDVIELSEGRGRLAGTAPVGQRLLVRPGDAEITLEAVKQRRGLAEGGLLVATVVIDHVTGALLTGPRLEGRGLATDEQTSLHHLEDPIRKGFLGVAPSLRLDEALAVEELTSAVRRAVRERIGRRISVVAQVVKL